MNKKIILERDYYTKDSRNKKKKPDSGRSVRLFFFKRGFYVSSTLPFLDDIKIGQMFAVKVSFWVDL